MEPWWIFLGEGLPHRRIDGIPRPMPARDFNGGPLVEPQFGEDRAATGHLGLADRHLPLLLSKTDLDLINAAILWRKPLLVTGSPGSGKSSLAYAIARELSLGPVLHWPVTSRTTLRDGLYSYDALARLEEANLQRLTGVEDLQDIGSFIRLGPLGTALLPYASPRVVLVDELDKSDLDLPNDLLHTFESGEFEIEELRRQRDGDPVTLVGVTGGTTAVPVAEGRVRCHAFPIIVLTDNGEREFSQAFLRRCVRLRLTEPGPARLAGIVEAHLGAEGVQASADLIEDFLRRRAEGTVATDQLLGAVYLTVAARLGAADRDALAELIMKPLDQTG